MRYGLLLSIGLPSRLWWDNCRLLAGWDNAFFGNLSSVCGWLTFAFFVAQPSLKLLLEQNAKE
jgi:hypothetical protein